VIVVTSAISEAQKTQFLCLATSYVHETGPKLIASSVLSSLYACNFAGMCYASYPSHRGSNRPKAPSIPLRLPSASVFSMVLEGDCDSLDENLTNAYGVGTCDNDV
jgi:hypothetical protein